MGSREGSICFRNTNSSNFISSSTTTTPSPLPSSSGSVIRKTPRCVRLNYNSFEDWISDPNHVYIGRKIGKISGSKWGNPFGCDKTNKNSIKLCLERYEDHIRRDPDLFNAVMELEGKVLGCWCKPSPCHGDILIKLFKEKQIISP